MPLPTHKTKIVATIGPASESPEMLERLIRAGLDVARLNFSHGDFAAHAGRIANIRRAEAATGRRVAIMADLPGPKMRVGTIDPEPIELRAGDPFTLTTDEVTGSSSRVSVSFERLPEVVRPGNRLFLNDGLVQLRSIASRGATCTAASPWAANCGRARASTCPGIDLGIRAFTDHDRACLAFALEHGVDAVSQSFVETADDVTAVRDAARALGGDPFIIAKIERAGALEHYEEHPPRRRRRDGGARRPGRRGADRAHRAHAEGSHREGEHRRQTGDHGHADAGVDGDAAACRRARRRPTSPTRSSTAPTA